VGSSPTVGKLYILYISMLLYSYDNKFNTLVQKQNVNTLKTFEIQELDLLYKSKKISILYSLFLYYLRIIYKLLINMYFLKSKKYRNAKSRIYYYISTFYRKLKGKRFFSRSIVLSMLSFFTSIYQSKIILLSVFLEKNGTFIMIRNLNKLTTLVRTKISKITKLNITQLFKLSKTIKKYMWHYNKIILERVRDNKFNFYIKLIMITANLKYNQIYTYLSTNKLNNNIMFINWFSTVIEYYMQKVKYFLSPYQNKLAGVLAKYSFGIIKSPEIKLHNTIKYINIKNSSSYFSNVIINRFRRR
jgi:hypothetical protein